MIQLQELLQQNKEAIYEEEWLIRVHHVMMKEYGWIPFNEFRELPIPTMLNLLKCIQEDYEKQKQENEKMKQKMPKTRSH